MGTFLSLPVVIKIASDSPMLTGLAEKVSPSTRTTSAMPAPRGPAEDAEEEAFPSDAGAEAGLVAGLCPHAANADRHRKSKDIQCRIISVTKQMNHEVHEEHKEKKKLSVFLFFVFFVVQLLFLYYSASVSVRSDANFL